MSSDCAIRDGDQVLIRTGGQLWTAAWHPPQTPPAGRPHGAAGVCVTADGLIVEVSEDGRTWDLPAGRPEPGETWEQTLHREMLEEACATVLRARLIGFSHGACLEGRERGLVLVRSWWRADVELADWLPRFEIAHRRLTPPHVLWSTLDGHPYAHIIRRALREAGVH